MICIKNRQINITARKKLKSYKGMTMVEMLITVAIIMVLMGVGFVAIVNYQRSLGQTERDGNAKEIFIAAQNHLTMVRGEGYFDLETDVNSITDATKKNTAVVNAFGTEEGSGKYYFVIESGKIANEGATATINDESSLAGMMLPFGSIDETVRTGGSYIIEYELRTATVLNVFYTSQSGSPSSFNYSLSKEKFSEISSYGVSDAEKKKSRRNMGNWILGWYGGSEAASQETTELTGDLTLTVNNGDTLNVVIADENKKNCTLIMTGVTSNAKKSVYYNGSEEYTVVIDDISSEGRHFYDFTESTDTGDLVGHFIPGEDVEFQAIAYDNDNLSNIIYSDIKTENSLYGSITEEKCLNTSGEIDTINTDSIYKVSVYSIRHLENLEEEISHTGKDYDDNDKQIIISSVYQTGDMDLEGYENNTNSEKKIYKITDSSKDPVSIDYYYPVSYETPLIYDGLGHSISNIKVKSGNDNNGGLFGTIVSDSGSSKGKIKNLELIDFNVSGVAYAGALAGTTVGTNINNVIAHNSTGDNGKDSIDTVTINASTSISSTSDESDTVKNAAGGLVGYMSGGNIMYSGAALVVNGTDNAGGLVGVASGATIKACYSGGHTDQGEYYNHTSNGRSDAIYNIKATTHAGGLVGDAADATINACYSTCSANATGDSGICGGLAGSVNEEEATIKNCYCTGLVSGKTAYAFVGSGSLSQDSTGNSYYEIINEDTDNDGNITYMDPISSDNGSWNTNVVDAFDKDAGTFDGFTGGDWNEAEPYDSQLETYYNNKYCIKTSTQIMGGISTYKDSDGNDIKYDAIGTSYFANTHYGDWPAPEIFIINE